MSVNTSYESDVVAWANEQAALIRARRFEQLDVTHIAEEIEDVGKSEQRELSSRIAALIANLLKWQYLPAKRIQSWQRTIKIQRQLSVRRIKSTPSLAKMLTDPEWLDDIWVDATVFASKETGLDASVFPETSPWVMADVLTDGWLPA